MGIWYASDYYLAFYTDDIDCCFIGLRGTICYDYCGYTTGLVDGLLDGLGERRTFGVTVERMNCSELVNHIQLLVVDIHYVLVMQRDSR